MCFDQLEPRLVHTLLHKLVSFDRLKHKEGLFFFCHLLTSGGGDQEMADSGHISAVLLVFFFLLCVIPTLLAILVTSIRQ